MCSFDCYDDLYKNNLSLSWTLVARVQTTNWLLCVCELALAAHLCDFILYVTNILCSQCRKVVCGPRTYVIIIKVASNELFLCSISIAEKINMWWWVHLSSYRPIVRRMRNLCQNIFMTLLKKRNHQRRSKCAYDDDEWVSVCAHILAFQNKLCVVMAMAFYFWKCSWNFWYDGRHLHVW